MGLPTAPAAQPPTSRRSASHPTPPMRRAYATLGAPTLFWVKRLSHHNSSNFRFSSSAKAHLANDKVSSHERHETKARSRSARISALMTTPSADNCFHLASRWPAAFFR